MSDEETASRADGEGGSGESGPGENGAPGEEGFESRGVQNPRIVDLIQVDPTRQEVVLAIFEPRRWMGEQSQLMEHEDKLNSYFGYVLDGHLEKQYPQYADMPVRIELRCAEEPGEGERPFLGAVSRFCAENGLRFTVAVTPDPLGDPAPWEEG